MSLLRHSAGLGLARLGEKVLAFGVILAASRLYGSTGLGEFFYFFSLACLFLPLVDLGLSKVLLQDWYTLSPQQRRLQIGRMLSAKCALTLLAILLAVIADAFVRGPADANPLAITFAVLAIALENLALFLRTPAQAADRWKREAIVPLLARCLTLALLFLLAGQAGLLQHGWQIVLLYAASNALAVLLSLPGLDGHWPALNLQKSINKIPQSTPKHSQFTIHHSQFTIKNYIRRGIPFSLTGVFVMISLHIDSVMLGRHSLEETGLYNAGYRVILVGIAITGGATHALFPRIVRLRNAGDPTQAAALVGHVLRVLLLLALAGAAGGILVADDLMTLLYGPDFRAAALPFAILCLLLPLAAATNILGHTLEATGQQKAAMWITLRSASFNVCANLLLIPVLGMTGAALTTVATETASLAQLLHHLHREPRPAVRYHGLWRVLPFAAAVSLGFLLLIPLTFWLQLLLGTLLVLTLLAAFHRFWFHGLINAEAPSTPHLPQRSTIKNQLS